jgi:hypothetical protein
MRRERRCLALLLLFFLSIASIAASFLLPSSEIGSTTTSIMSKLPRVDFDSTIKIASTRWMRLETLTYHVADDKSESGSAVRKWDRAVRTTKKSEDSIDAVGKKFSLLEVFSLLLFVRLILTLCRPQ